MKLRRRVRVPAKNGVPSDLPPWARDELVARRLRCHDLEVENDRLRIENARLNGKSMTEILTDIISRPIPGGKVGL